MRGGEAVLLVGVTITAAGAAFGHGQALAIAAASMAGAALIVLLANLTFDFDASARAHSACGAPLWGLRERYRSLLSDLHDGALSTEAARIRRDKLIEELRAIYETSAAIALEDGHAQPAIAVEAAVASQPPARRTA